MSKSKRRTKTGPRRGGKTGSTHAPQHAAAPAVETSTDDTPLARPAKPPAKNLPLLIAATVLLVGWLCVLTYLAVVSLSQPAG